MIPQIVKFVVEWSWGEKFIPTHLVRSSIGIQHSISIIDYKPLVSAFCKIWLGFWIPLLHWEHKYAFWKHVLIRKCTAVSTDDFNRINPYLSLSKNLHTLQKYFAMENPSHDEVLQIGPMAWIFRQRIHIISTVFFLKKIAKIMNKILKILKNLIWKHLQNYLSIEWSLTLSWQNLHVNNLSQHTATNLQFLL